MDLSTNPLAPKQAALDAVLLAPNVPTDEEIFEDLFREEAKNPDFPPLPSLATLNLHSPAPPLPNVDVSMDASSKLVSAQAEIARLQRELEQTRARRSFAEILMDGMLSPKDVERFVSTLCSLVLRERRIARGKAFRLEQIRHIKELIRIQVQSFIDEHLAKNQAPTSEPEYMCIVHDYGSDDEDAHAPLHPRHHDEHEGHHNVYEDEDPDDFDDSLWRRNRAESALGPIHGPHREESMPRSPESHEPSVVEHAGPTDEERPVLEQHMQTAEDRMRRSLNDLSHLNQQHAQVLPAVQQFMTGVINLLRQDMQAQQHRFASELARTRNATPYVSKIDIWPSDKTKGTSLHDWLQHVAIVLTARNVHDEEARVLTAATFLRGNAATRWQQREKCLRQSNEPITWDDFTVTLQTQHDGVIPAQKALKVILNLIVNKGEQPRQLTVRMMHHVDQILLQEGTSRVLLPTGEIIIGSYLRALSTWPAVHTYATQFHTEQLRKWDQEGLRDRSIYQDTNAVKARWLQMLRDLAQAVQLWDTGNKALGLREDTDTLRRARTTMREERSRQRYASGRSAPPSRTPNQPREQQPPRDQQRATQNESRLTCRGIFNITEEEFQARRAAGKCVSCNGNRHQGGVINCPSMTAEQKAQYEAYRNHVSAKKRQHSSSGGGNKRSRT